MIGLRDKLNDKNVSPNVKRLILKERAGIKLNEREKRVLKNEMVSMVSPTAYHNRMKPIASTLKSIDRDASNDIDINDLDDDDEIDISELLDEFNDEEDDDYSTAIEEVLIEIGFYDEEDEEISESLGEGVAYSIEYKTPFGKYKSILKNFNSEKHFSNWYTYMAKKGYKIIGVNSEDGR